MTDGLYIWVPRWKGKDGFQHYSSRDPIWIKNYTRLLDSDAYRDLSFHCRGVLHGIWLTYATSGRQLSDSTQSLSRRLGYRVMRRDLDSLVQAGFIELIASTELARRLQDASPEKRREEKNKPSVLPSEAREQERTEGEDIDFDTIDYNHILKEIPL